VNNEKTAKTLLHTCCAPCSIACIDTLRGEGIEPVGFWFNPNIHPYTEYQNRKNAFVEYAASIDMDMIMEDHYGLRPFVRNVADDIENRCGYCYNVRMEAAAQCAAQHGFDSFCTTLLVSPYQKQDLLCEIAEQAAFKHGVQFLYRDFRPFFREGQKRARELGLYMQKYCGCIFSEEDRYQRAKKA
jgi:predicted adenine nucleotide alpha hydrolase (AANH) superfamily ATPase